MKQASYVAAHDATARAGRQHDLVHVAKRFISHPWGKKGDGPAGAGARPWRGSWRSSCAAIARRGALPIAVLTVAQLAVCLKVMDPADAVRYALPVVLGVAFAAAVGIEALARRAGCRRRPGSPRARWRRWRSSTPGRCSPRAPGRPPPRSPRRAGCERPRAAEVGGPGGRRPGCPTPPTWCKGFDLSLIEDGFHHAALRPGAQAWLFAEGESRWPGAVTFRWPESDAYHKLTRDHYRVVSLSPIPLDHRFKSLRGVYDWEPSLLDAQLALAGRRRGGPDLPPPVVPGGPRRPGARSHGAAAVEHRHRLARERRGHGAPAVTVEIPRGARRTVELPLPGPRPVRDRHPVGPLVRARAWRLPPARRAAPCRRADRPLS